MFLRKYFPLAVAFLLSVPAPTGEARPARIGREEPASGGNRAPVLSVVSPPAWFVELSSAPLAEVRPANETKYLARLRQEKQAFRTAAGRAGVRYRERYAYDLLWNGLSVEIDPADLLALSRLPGVAALYPIEVEKIPESPARPLDPGNTAPELLTAITMTGADRAQSEGVRGTGVRVGVIDSGIDYFHPDLGGGFGPGFRVEGGFDLAGNFFIGPGSFPTPDPDPMDCNGHGTHVAGIIGADGAVRGVAPAATLRAYKVFGCFGSTTTDVVLAAMERALADGNQVMNMSFGSNFRWPQYPTARGADNLVNHGVVVVASAGNDGEEGLYSVGAPGVGGKTIGVGSVDNDRIHSRALRLPAGELIGYQPLGDALPPPLAGSGLVANGGRGCNADRAGLAGVRDRLALLVRGACSLREKVLNARNAGATGVLIYNNVPGIFFETVGEPPILLPAAGLSGQDGLFILARTPTLLTWTDQFAEAPFATGGLVSDFSSYGNSPDLDLKPDLTAPGGHVFSTLLRTQGGYGLLSGTSMSSPHVAGAAALLLQARPHTPSQAVRDMLQNSAVPHSSDEAPAFLESAHRQGAGLLDIEAAIRAVTRVTPAKIALGETEGRPVTRGLTIENDGPVPILYDLSSQPALATGPDTFHVVSVPAAAGVSFSSESVQVPAGGSAEVKVTFTDPPDLPDGSLFGGSLVLTPPGKGRPVRVPFSGFKGDYQSIVVIDPAASEFGNPILRPSPTFGPDGPITIEPGRNQVAFVLFQLRHPVRRVRLELFDAVSLRARGRLAEFPYFSRNTALDEFFLLVWDGRDAAGDPAPAGDFVVRLSVQKALGGDDNPAHWESWTSPVVTVIR